MAIIGSGVPVGKIAAEAFPPLLAAGLRTSIAVSVLLPWFWLRARDDLTKLRGSDWLRVFAIGFVCVFLFSILNLFGLKMAPVVVAGLVRSTTPAVTAVASYVFLGDRLGWRRIAFLALAFLGLLAVSLDPHQDSSGRGQVFLGTLLILGAVACDAAYTLLGKKAMERLRPVTVAALSAGSATGLFLPFAAVEALRFDTSAPGERGWIALLWLGIAVGALGPLLWFRGVRWVSGSTAAVFMGVMPVSAMLLSYLLTDASFSWIHLVGITGVLLSIVCICRDDAQS